MSILPVEITTDIFLRLDEQSLMKAKCVCHEWNTIGGEEQRREKEAIVKRFVRELDKGTKPFEDFYKRKLTEFIPEYDPNKILITHRTVRKTTKIIEELKSNIISAYCYPDSVFPGILQWDASIAKAAQSDWPNPKNVPPVNSEWVELAFFQEKEEGSDYVSFYTPFSKRLINLHKAFLCPVVFPIGLFQGQPKEVLLPLCSRVIKIIPTEKFYEQLNKRTILPSIIAAAMYADFYYVLERDATEINSLEQSLNS